MFGGSIYGAFFGGLFADMDRMNDERKKEKLGITSGDGFYGSDFLGIPYLYSDIRVKKNILECDIPKGVDSERKMDVYLISENESKFIFCCFKYDSLGEGMFLVQNERDGKKALYNEAEKLTEFLYEKNWGDWAKNSNYCSFGSSSPEKYRYQVVLNKQGEEIIENEYGFSNYINVHGCVACVDKFWYNLDTLEKICSKDYDSPLETDEFLFISCGKNSVYQINKLTGEYTVHGVPDENLIEKPKNIVVPTPKKEKKEKTESQQRNDLCACGSGLKYKKCCLVIKID